MTRAEIISDIVQKTMVLSDAKLEGVQDFVNFLSDRNSNKIEPQEEVPQQNEAISNNNVLPVQEIILNPEAPPIHEVIPNHEVDFNEELISNQPEEKITFMDEVVPDENLHSDSISENVTQNNHEDAAPETKSGFDFFQDEEVL